MFCHIWYALYTSTRYALCMGKVCTACIWLNLLKEWSQDQIWHLASPRALFVSYPLLEFHIFHISSIPTNIHTMGNF